MKSAQAQQQTAKKTSAQQYLPIAEIRDGVVILKDGTLRGVFLVSSINFSLKSEDEQNALVSGYVGFLNGLNHPLQIVMQSRRLQIKPYLEQLMSMEQKQRNELLRAQTADYRSFVTELVSLGDIMTKRFYVVVPYDPMTNKKKGFFSRVKDVLKPLNVVRISDTLFDQRKQELDSRMRQVENGLGGLGLVVARLDTQSLIELYYNTYNPDIAFSEQLTEVDMLRVET